MTVRVDLNADVGESFGINKSGCDEPFVPKHHVG